jgi:predicted acyltransferase
MGMNAITLYMISEFGAELLDMANLHAKIYNFFLSMASPVNASLLYSVAFMLSIYVIGYLMYRRRWFLKI